MRWTPATERELFAVGDVDDPPFAREVVAGIAGAMNEEALGLVDAKVIYSALILSL